MREVLLWAHQGHGCLLPSLGKAGPWNWPGLCEELAAPGQASLCPWWVQHPELLEPTPSHTHRGSEATGPQSCQDGEGPVEAEGLWLMNEASQHERRSVGAMALGGSLLEGSRPGGRKGQPPPQDSPKSSPLVALAEAGTCGHLSCIRKAGQGFRMSTLPLEPHLPGPVSPAREARRTWGLFRPAFHSLRSSSPGLPLPWDWLLEVPPVQPTFPHGKQEAGLACPRRIE